MFPDLDDALGNPVVKELPNGDNRTVIGSFTHGTPSGTDFVQIRNSANSVLDWTIVGDAIHCYKKEGRYFFKGYVYMTPNATVNTDSFVMKFMGLNILNNRATGSSLIGTANVPSQLVFANNGSDIAVSIYTCLLYTSPSPRDGLLSRMPSSA